MVGGRIDVAVRESAEIELAARALAEMTGSEPEVDVDRRRLSVPVRAGALTLPVVVRRLDTAGIDPEDVAVRQPTLDEVFLTLTDNTATTKEAVRCGCRS
jgi:ABC-2 type transport system ATP-binding protein